MGKIMPNKEAVFKDVAKSIEAMEARFATNIAALIFEADHMLKSLTPVHTGQAVRNYIWTIGARHAGVEQAIDNGPTGRTNSMALGSEPRRPPNEHAAAESLLALSFVNPFQVFMVTNNSPDIEGLELGQLPGDPMKSRSPNGMFGLTNAYIAAKVAVKGVLS